MPCTRLPVSFIRVCACALQPRPLVLLRRLNCEGAVTPVGLFGQFSAWRSVSSRQDCMKHLQCYFSLLSLAETPIYLSEWMIVIYIIAGTLFCTLFYVCILLCRCVTSGKKHRRKDRSTSPGDQLVMVLPYEGALGPIKNDCVYMYFINRHKFNI